MYNENIFINEADNLLDICYLVFVSNKRRKV